MPPDDKTDIRVWDLPTRLFHWALAACVLCSVLSAKIGGNALAWHFRFGYAVLALLIFRLLWGLIGGRWSRFAAFVYGPGAVVRYLRGAARPGDWFEVGHNPLGALSVFALLALLTVQVGTGLVADDEIGTVGPLNRLVSGATAASATGWHKSWGQWLLLSLVGLHVVAIGVYTFRGQGLIGAMVSGDKLLPPATPAAADNRRTRALALALLVGCALAVAALLAWAARGGS